MPLHGQFQAEVPPTREDRIRVFSTFIYLSNCELHQMNLSSFDAPNTSSIFNCNSSGFGYIMRISHSPQRSTIINSWLQNSGRDSNFLQCRLKSENVRAMPIWVLVGVSKGMGLKQLCVGTGMFSFWNVEVLIFSLYFSRGSVFLLLESWVIFESWVMSWFDTDSW